MIDSPVPTKKSQISPPTEESTAPYFTDWLRQQVVDKYGAGQAFGGGLQIKSTLDLDLQNAAEQIVSDRLSGLGPTAAVVVIDNGSGEVLAMVGGQDFDQQPVQPGHQRPAPAGLLVQAVHARHRAQGGPLARRGLRVRPAVSSRSRRR